jgi:hypothetical protein
MAQEWQIFGCPNELTQHKQGLVISVKTRSGRVEFVFGFLASFFLHKHESHEICFVQDLIPRLKGYYEVRVGLGSRCHLDGMSQLA